MSSAHTELSVDAAIEAVLDAVAPGSIPDELLRVDATFGRVLARSLHARWPIPSAPLSILDGYAVRSGDLLDARALGASTLVLALASESAAGHPSADVLAPGTCMQISTGAVVPTGADAVVAREDTQRVGEQIEFSSTALADAGPGRWIRPIGSDVIEGECLLEPGVVIGPGEAALLAGAGHVEIAVRRRPIVAILGTGDELVPIGQRPGHGQIISTNTMMVAAQIREAGGEPLDLGLIPDREPAVRAAIERAIEQADVLIGTGGISVGEHDLILPVLQQLGFTQRFRKIALRPGRPTTFGWLPRGLCLGPRPPDSASPARPRGNLSVLALPGNPAATMVAFELLGRPMLRALLGLPRHRWHRRVQMVELAGTCEGERTREHFVRAKLDEHGRAHPLAKQLSGALRSLADVDVLVRVPAGRTRVEIGESLPALCIRE